MSTKCYSNCAKRKAQNLLNFITQIFWYYSQDNFSYNFLLVNCNCKKPSIFYFQLGCKLIDLLTFFYCVDEGWHWATHEGLVKIKGPHQQWRETRLWMSNLQSLAKSRGTQRSYHWRGLFFLINIFVNFISNTCGFCNDGWQKTFTSHNH